MKVLQIPFHYYPDAVGGTEVYVSLLAKRLREQGIEVEIAAPAKASAEYMHDGITVHRFGITEKPQDITMLYGQGDPFGAQEFAGILDRCRPDVVHVHAMSPAVSLMALKQVKERGMPVIFTCHIPGIICQRGTLLRNGREVCDGLWGLQKCTACALQGHGLPVPFARLLSGISPTAGRALATFGVSGPVVTALRMRELMAGRHRALVEFFDCADRVIAVSAWLRDMLITNGLDRNKVTLCRHGSSHGGPRSGADDGSTTRDNRVFKLAFFGRLNPTKGADILVEAIQRRPRMRIELDIFGIVQDDTAYVDQLRSRVGNDSRIQLRAALPNEAVVEKLREYDALAVPSQWMETGPLVVYDAFLAGIPVIGSKRGGLTELVTHGRDGLLVEPADPEAWADCLDRLSSDAELQDQLRAGVRPPRSMSEVASEMLDVYNQVSSKMMAVNRG